MGFARSATPDSASIERQKGEIAAFAARESFELTEILVFDGVGGNDDRPIEMILKRKSECDSFDFLIITEISRLTQAGAFQGPLLLRRLQSAGIIVVSINESVPGQSTAIGSDLLQSVIATMKVAAYRDHMYARWLARGFPGTLPFGVDRLFSDRRTRKPIFISRMNDDDSRSLIQPETGEVMLVLPRGYASIRVASHQIVEFVPGEARKIKAIRYVFDQFFESSTRWSPTKVARHLNEVGITSFHGRPWTICSVRAVAGNPVYAGFSLYLASRHISPHSTSPHSKFPQRRPPADFRIFEHPKLKSVFMDDARGQQFREKILKKLRNVE